MGRFVLPFLDGGNRFVLFYFNSRLIGGSSRYLGLVNWVSFDLWSDVVVSLSSRHLLDGFGKFGFVDFVVAIKLGLGLRSLCYTLDMNELFLCSSCFISDPWVWDLWSYGKLRRRVSKTCVILLFQLVSCDMK